MDGLLAKLNDCGVGCHWCSLFAGAFCYADDIVLLAPCASALRTMLSICNNFAVSHGLHFNVSKTQVICFRSPSTRPCSATILFNNKQLHLVTHLGHILTSNLNNKQDTIRVIKDMNRKANSILCTFSSADPFVVLSSQMLPVWLHSVVSFKFVCENY